MPQIEKIKEHYKAIHDDLSKRYYELNELDKGTFDQLHGDNWNAMEAELIAAGYLQESVVSIDIESEVISLKDRVTKLEGMER